MLKRFLGAAAIAMCATPASVMAQTTTSTGSRDTASADAASGQTDRLQEIIVTAQKREQNLQDVPISVTAIGQNQLAVNRIQNILDLSAIAPNLTLHLAAGGTSVPAIVLRGEESFGGIPGEDRQVSIYLDGAYLGFAVGSLFTLADIDRIEVLKGPQGTLFGRNATAGAISIVTRQPSGKFQVHQELTAGNYDEFQNKTRIDLPAWGPFSAMVSYLHEQHRGDIRNLGAGAVWHYPSQTYTSPTWLGSDNTNAVTAALKFEPSDAFNVVYKFDWTEDHSTPEGVGLLDLNVAALSAIDPGFPALLAAQPNPALLTKISTSKPSAVNNSFSTPNYLRTSGHNVTAQLHLNDQISLKNILSFRSAYSTANYQLDGYGGLVIPGTGDPFVLFGINRFAHLSLWSDESRSM